MWDERAHFMQFAKLCLFTTFYSTCFFSFTWCCWFLFSCSVIKVPGCFLLSICLCYPLYCICTAACSSHPSSSLIPTELHPISSACFFSFSRLLQILVIPQQVLFGCYLQALNASSKLCECSTKPSSRDLYRLPLKVTLLWQRITDYTLLPISLSLSGRISFLFRFPYFIASVSTKPAS